MNKNISISLILLFLLHACGINRTYNKTLKEDANFINKSKLYKKIQQNTLDFNTLNVVRFSGNIETNNSRKSFKGSYRIKKDSIIWISVNLFGIEFMRAKFTQDSLYLINRKEKTYFARSFDDLINEIGIDINYHTVEKILSNQLFMYPDNNSQNINIEKNNENYLLKNNKKKEYYKKGKPIKNLIKQIIYVDTKNFKINKVTLTENFYNTALILHYNDFKNINNLLFPHNIIINLEVNNKKTLFEIKCNKITLNTPTSFPFRIPEKYKNIK